LADVPMRLRTSHGLSRGWCLIFLTALVISAVKPAVAGEPQRIPLHDRIDEVLEALPEDGPVAPQASDPEFLRRVMLDLCGLAPTEAELAAFEADPSADKRARLIDRLISDPLHIEHLVITMDRQLMERRGFNHVGRAEWISWLRGRLDAKQSLVDICRSILLADGTHVADRPPVRFFLERDSDPHRITRDIARLMLGRDIQCAQCHNHPAVAEYWQADYHGLLSFMAPSYAVELVGKDAEGKEVKKSVYLERAVADAPFESVFQRGTLLRTGPRMWGGPETKILPVALDPAPSRQADQDVVPNPTQPLPVLPGISRRQLLVERLLAADHREFARNWANRLWSVMFGRGLVEPLDMHHSGNPPEGGPLLEVLADGLIELEFQPSEFLRQIALSDVYQRSHWLPSEEQRFASVSRPTTELAADRAAAEALVASRKAAAAAAERRVDFALQNWLSLEAQRVALFAKRDAAEQSLTHAAAPLAEAQQKLADTRRALEDGRNRAKLLSGITAHLAIAAKAAGDSPLGHAARSVQAMTLTELEQAVANAEAAQQAAITAQQQARDGLQQAQTELDGLDPRWQAADLALRSARSASATTQSEVVVADRALARLIARTRGVELVARIRAADEQLAGLAARHEQALAVVTSAQQQVAASEQTLAAAQARLPEKQQALAAVQLAQQQPLQAIAQLDQALQGLSAAQGLLADAAPLMQAITALQSEREVRQRTLAEATAAVTSQQSELEQLQSQSQAAVAEIESARSALGSAEAQRLEVEQELQAHRSERDGLIQQQEVLWREQMDQWSRSLHSYPLRAMTPEQLGWSTLRSTGVFDRYVDQARREMDQASPATAEQSQDPAWLAERHRAAVRKAIEDLRGNVDQFANLYGGAAGQPEADFFATAEQALFAANGGAIFAWSAPAAGNPAQAVVDSGDPKVAARAVYRGVLTREPTALESQDISEYLASRSEQKPQVAQEMVWGLLTSVEYRFYH
jgi:hypothetical protein